MISIRKQSYGLNVALYNEFTVKDFEELELAVNEIVQTTHKPKMLLDLSMLRDFTIDMAWEQLKFLRDHHDTFGKIAVVENHQNEDGSIRIPKALQAYLGGLEVLR